MELLLIAFMTSPVVLAALIAVIGAAIALSRTRAEKPTHTETSVVIYIPAPHDPPRPVQTVIHEHHHYHVDNRSVTMLSDQVGGVQRAVTVHKPTRALLPPAGMTPERQITAARERAFRVVGEMEEW